MERATNLLSENMEATAIGSEVHSSMFFKLFKALKRSFYHYVQRMVNVRDFSFLSAMSLRRTSKD